MNKYEWKTLVRKTAWASGKKRLNSKELMEVAKGVIALEKLKPKKNDPNTPLRDILYNIVERKKSL